MRAIKKCLRTYNDSKRKLWSCFHLGNFECGLQTKSQRDYEVRETNTYWRSKIVLKVIKVNETGLQFIRMREARIQVSALYCMIRALLSENQRGFWPTLRVAHNLLTPHRISLNLAIYQALYEFTFVNFDLPCTLKLKSKLLDSLQN